MIKDYLEIDIDGNNNNKREEEICSHGFQLSVDNIESSNFLNKTYPVRGVLSERCVT